jgi:hypothetical protein
MMEGLEAGGVMAFNPYDHNARYEDVTVGFIAESRRNLFAAYMRVEHCVEQLTEEEVWWRPREEMNAVGNLMLHLAGNVGQWITSAVRGEVSGRNRPVEFSERGPVAKAVLQERLKGAVEAAMEAMAGVKTAEELLAGRRVQGNETTVLTAIYHSVSHFEGHAQEIVGMTRQMKGAGYRFLWEPRTAEQVSGG